MNITDDEVDRLRGEADRAVRCKNYKVALDIYAALAKRNIPDALLMCGLIHEKGWDNTLLDLDKASGYYTKLAIIWNADEGYLGCIRIILATHEIRRRDTALEYCRNIVNGRYRRDGYMNMGHVYEELFDPPERKMARRAYFNAFLSGSSWALRQYAISLIQSRNYIGGAAMHVVATIVSPFLVLGGGWGATRRG